MFFRSILFSGAKITIILQTKAIIYARKEKYCIFILISHCFDVPLQRKWLISSHRKQKYNYKIKNGKDKDINYR